MKIRLTNPEAIRARLNQSVQTWRQEGLDPLIVLLSVARGAEHGFVLVWDTNSNAVVCDLATHWPDGKLFQK